MQWNKTYGGTNGDAAFSLVQTSDGGYAVAGGQLSFGAGNHDFWLVKTDTFGTMQWNQNLWRTSSRYLSLFNPHSRWRLCNGWIY